MGMGGTVAYSNFILDKRRAGGLALIVVMVACCCGYSFWSNSQENMSSPPGVSAARGPEGSAAVMTGGSRMGPAGLDRPVHRADLVVVPGHRTVRSPYRTAVYEGGPAE